MNHDSETGDDLDVLHYNKDGYVAFCAHCSQVQIAFGTTIINFEPEQLHRWYANLHHEMRRFENRICPCEKFFMFTTDSDMIRLMLTWNELNALCDMLSPAMMVLEARSILELN